MVTATIARFSLGCFKSQIRCEPSVLITCEPSTSKICLPVGCRRESSQPTADSRQPRSSTASEPTGRHGRPTLSVICGLLPTHVDDRRQATGDRHILSPVACRGDGPFSPSYKYNTRVATVVGPSAAMGKAHDRARSGRGKRKRFEQGAASDSEDGEAVEYEEEEADDAAEGEEPQMRVNRETVQCITCGTTDSSDFSQRMLHARGRHGERVRRCRICVTATEEAERAAAEERRLHPPEPQAAEYADEDAAGDEASRAVEKKRKKLLKALRSIDEIRVRRENGAQLEKTQLEKLNREMGLRQELAELPSAEGEAPVPKAAEPPVDKKKRRKVVDGEERPKKAKAFRPSDFQPAFMPPHKVGKF